MSDAVWVPVNAEMKGFIGTLVKEASGAAKKGGAIVEKEFAASGKRAGESMASGLQASAAKVSQVSTKLATARKAEAQAAADVGTAEAKLENLRNSGNAKASQLAKAEQQLETAKNKQADAAVRVSREEKNLDAARSGGQTKSTALARAEDQLANARTSQQTASAKIRTAEIQLDEARANAKSKSDAVSAAEKNLMDTRDRYGANTKQTAAAERQLESAKKQAATANNQVATAEGRVKRTRAESQSAADTLKAKELSLKAVQEDLARSSQRTAEKTNTMGDSFKNAAGKAADFAGKYKIHATAALGGIGLIAKESIAYASEAEQSYGAVESIFGDHAQGIISASKGAAEAVGLSGREYRELTSSTGAMLKNMGMPMDEVASKSQDLVGVASDLAATFGGSTKDAIEAVNALMRGEADPIERYGVSIKKSDINARMAAKGLDGLTGAAAKQAEAQTMLELLTEQTADAQGQFGRESDTAAHKQQVATAKYNDAKEAIGTGLLPMFAELASKGAVLAGVVGRHPKVFLALGTAVTAAAGAIVGISAVSSAVSALGGMAKIASVASKMMTGLKVAMTVFTGPIGLIVAGVAAVVAGLVLFFTKTETGRKLWASFTEALGKGWDWAVEKFKAGIEWVKTNFGPTFESVKEKAIGIWDGVTEKVSAAFGKIKEIISGALEFWKTGDTTDYAQALGMNPESPIFGFLEGFRDKLIAAKDFAVEAFQNMKTNWETFTTGFGQFYQTWIAPVVGFFMSEVQLLGTIAGAIWEGIKSGFQVLGKIISTVWTTFISPVFGFFKAGAMILGQAIMSAIQGVIIPIWNFLGAQISNIWTNIIQPVWEFIKSAAGLLADVLTGNFSNIGNRFSELGGSISGIVHGVIRAAMDTFRNIVKMVGQVWDNFKQIVSNAVSNVVSSVQRMIGHMKEIPGKIKGVFSEAGQWLVDAGSNIIGGLWSGLQNAWNNVANWLSDLPSKIRNSIGSISFDIGGFFGRNAKGSYRAYVDGGIQRLESYANGGGTLPKQAVIEPPHGTRGLVQWAESSTKGEAFIPMGEHNRARSTAITAKVADEFGYVLVDKKTGEPYSAGSYGGDLGPQVVGTFAEGGITAQDLRKFAEGQTANGFRASRPLEGAPYVWGGSNWGDCSGTMSAFAALAVGKNPFPRKFATGSEAAYLSSVGFHRGRGGEGDLRIGFRDGGPAGGHTAGTLPDGTNIEMGGGRGNGQLGGGAAGAWDSYFNEFFYLPIKKKEWKDPKVSGLSGEITGSNAGVVDVDTGSFTASDLSVSTPQTQSRPLTPEEAAQAAFYKELGDKSLLDLAVDGVFEFFGMGNSLTKKLLTAKGSELAPQQSSVTSASTVSAAASGRDQARTSVAEKHAEIVQKRASEEITPKEVAKDPQLGQNVEKKPKAEWGESYFAYEIARSAKSKGLPIDGAKIGLATALVESGSPLKMWANRAVPESLNYKHDAVGSDYDSIGLFQQRNAGWGTVKQRMTPFDSAGMFFDVMLRKFPNWKSMDPGAVAQGVQVSAFPGRYAGQMERGLQLAKRSGVFDRGGLGYGKGLLPKDVVAPERVLSPQQTRAFDDLVYKQLPKQNGEGGRGDTTIVVNLDGEEIVRERLEKAEGKIEFNANELAKLKFKPQAVTAAINMMV
ncbi:hypothetical protein [Corynebacterium striatum]|uniref:hypothetical protein n=1 Tax=Corynebacterium striatum TaxID=43770 RepID=UPI003B5BBD4C